MSSSSRLLAVVAALALLAGAAGAQVALHHSFPVAGEVLTVVVDGAPVGDGFVDLRLSDVEAAPPSFVERLLENPAPRVDGDALVTTWPVDEAGRVRLDVLLDDARDAGAPLRLEAVVPGWVDASASLELIVVPPIVVVPTSSGYERIDLRSGSRLLPAIPRFDALRGLAVSDDGTETYALYADGRLETWSGQSWTAGPGDVTFLDPDANDIAGVPSGGLAFVLARSNARPFAPAGRLVFPDDGGASLVLEAMGETVTGRRWAVSEDGLVAYVAEDYLTVREVDLLHREVGEMFTTGRDGDAAIADLALDAERLYVVTSSVDDRPGSLTVRDLRSGRSQVFGLSVAPREVVALDGGVALVVPRSGGRLEVVVDGVPAGVMDVDGATWLDAASVPGAALLLRRDADGRHRLLRYDAVSGVVSTLIEGLPPVTQVLAQRRAADGHAVLLGDPSGSVWAFDLVAGELRQVSEVVVEPGVAIAQLP